MTFFVQAYYEYMVEVVTLLDGETELAARDMTDVLRFEIALANISLPRCANIFLISEANL